VRPDWYLDVDADADPAVLAELKQQSDGHCPSVFCIRHPIDLGTHVDCPR
jgi:hypothetical protein